MPSTCQQTNLHTLAHSETEDKTGYTIHIVTDVEVTIENHFPKVGNIPRGRIMTSRAFRKV